MLAPGIPDQSILGPREHVAQVAGYVLAQIGKGFEFAGQCLFDSVPYLRKAHDQGDQFVLIRIGVARPKYGLWVLLACLSLSKLAIPNPLTGTSDHVLHCQWR